ncbi:MAG: protein translocase subunit SecD [Bryobacteraceae bacterium]
MQSNLKYKWGVIVATILICLYGIIGLPKSPSEVVENWNKNIKLGLDLKGGSHLVLQVQVQDAFKSDADNTIERIKEDLRKASINYAALDRNDPQTFDTADQIQITVKGVPSEKSGDFRRIITDQYTAWNLTPVNSTDYRLNFKPTEALSLRTDTLERSMRTIEGRINSLGLTEPVVQQRGRSSGDAEILVQLPGVDDPARIKQILQTAALLEFYEVKDGPFPGQDAARAKHGGVLPLNTKLVRQQVRGGETSEGWYLLARTPVISGRDLRNSRPEQDQSGKWETGFTLTQDAKGRFGRFTEANIGNRLAIVMDNQVRSAPTIQARIEDQGRITGATSQQDAADLSLILRSGSLPASIVYLEERTVGPSLGADSIQQGLVAGLAGLIAVVAVMLLYYKKSGINATIALVLNAVILIAALAYFDAVLTLPGIAGIILTIGMAVDSNVLIFERIREELRAGKPPLAAMEAGFNKAFLTIIDTHVTTVVSCAFLFIFGTGPVRGFAVTLVIGLIANVFTAVFVSRTIFETELTGTREATSLSI